MAGAREELVAKRDSTSVVWQWFGFSKSDMLQSKVLCKLCHAVVGTSGGNTTNLFNHLKRRHPKEYEDSSVLRSSSIRSKRTWQQINVKYKNIIQGTNREQAGMRKVGETQTTEEYMTKEEPLENEWDVPIIESIVGGCCSDPGDVAGCSSYVKVNKDGLSLVPQAPLSEEEPEESEPLEDINVLYKKYLQVEISNRRQEMAYRALKMQKVEKEIELLDRKLADDP